MFNLLLVGYGGGCDVFVFVLGVWVGCVNCRFGYLSLLVVVVYCIIVFGSLLVVLCLVMLVLEFDCLLARFGYVVDLVFVFRCCL